MPAEVRKQEVAMTEAEKTEPAVIMQMKPKNKRDWRFIMCVKASTISANVRS